MQSYPHQYNVQASLESSNIVNIDSENLPRIESAPPVQFGGPGDRWSPETLLVAALADCFLLTFKAIARASKFSWSSVSCNAEGILDKESGAAQFTGFTLDVTLVIDKQAKEDTALQEKAKRLLHKSETGCLITNSLKTSSQLNITLQYS